MKAERARPVWAFESSKTTPSDTRPSTRPHLLILPKCSTNSNQTFKYVRNDHHINHHTVSPKRKRRDQLKSVGMEGSQGSTVGKGWVEENEGGSDVIENVYLKKPESCAVPHTFNPS